jgi:hypothetical protein
MIDHPLFSDDSADKTAFLKLFVRTALPGLPILVMGEMVGLARGWYGGGGFLLLLLLDLPMLFTLSTVLWFAIEGTAYGFAHTVLGMGNLKPEQASERHGPVGSEFREIYTALPRRVSAGPAAAATDRTRRRYIGPFSGPLILEQS